VFVVSKESQAGGMMMNQFDSVIKGPETWEHSAIYQKSANSKKTSHFLLSYTWNTRFFCCEIWKLEVKQIRNRFSSDSFVEFVDGEDDL
jgi:hypothetical protein